MTVRIKINTHNLKNIREYMNLTINEVSKKFENIVDWEKGTKEPTFKQVQELQKYYNKNYYFFIADENIKLEELSADYRNKSSSLSRKAIIALEIASSRAEAFQKIAKEMDFDFKLKKFKKISINDNPKEIAEYAVKELGINYRDIFNLKDKHGRTLKGYSRKNVILDYYKNIVESAGILVFESSSHSSHQFDDYRGSLIIKDSNVPFILLNGKEAFSGKLFSLMHEFAHYLLQNNVTYTSKNDLTDYYGNDKTEVWCNKFASNILMPEDYIKLDISSQDLDKKYFEDIFYKYGVSADSLYYRIKIIFESNKNLVNRAEELQKQVNAEVKKSAGGGINHTKNYIKKNGFAYSRLLIGAVDNQIIDIVDFGHYTGACKPEYIEKISAEVFK